MNALRLESISLKSAIPAVVLIVIAASCLAGCGGKAPVQVGFVAQLTGVQAELGVQERNGVQMAMEEINTVGGVAGRPVELIVQDDLGTPEGAQAADRELIRAGVVAIIGHATSGQTIAGLTVTNPAHVVMLSPTASTPELSGQDDYFFRVAQTLESRALAFAKHIYQDRNITRAAAIYDTDNAAYSKAYLEAFAGKYQSLGGKIVAEANFSSKAQPDFAPLATQLRTNNPDGLLIIAADMDTALIAQRTRLMGWPIPLFTTAWAQTETLIYHGGQAVEGLEIEMAVVANDQASDYLDFQRRFQAKFGKAPSFGAALGYEATKVLAAALQETGAEAEGLKQALLADKNIKGLSDTISFDRFGDVVRPVYFGVIREGKYVDIASSKPTEP
jgi:branched-chain amino acid transport system substrate-binding protein